MTYVNVATTSAEIVVTEETGAITAITTQAAPQVITVLTEGPQGPISTFLGSRSITIINPLINDNVTFYRTDVGTNLATVIALVSGTNPSVSYEIRYAADRTAVGTQAIIPSTVTSTTTGTAATIQNQPIPAHSYLWLIITAVTGTVGEVNVTLTF